MGFFSKLLKSNPPTPPVEASVEASPREASGPIETPRMVPAYVPPDARPTPTDVFDRPTIQQLEPALGERATMVAPEATVAALAKASSPPHPPAPRGAPALPPPVPRPLSTRNPPEKPPLPPAKPPVPSARKTTESPDRSKPVGAGPAPASTATPGTLKVDLTEVCALFGQLAVNHMRQVRDFLIELRWGPTPVTWVAVCEPSVVSLTRAAENMDLTALAHGLVDFTSAMRAVDFTKGTMIDGADRERILAAHAVLETILPETFALDSAQNQREATILHALLSQIPDVHKVTIDKLYAAGLTTLETMLLARTDDLVATTGIPEMLAARIVERFRRYREEMANARVDETRTHERAALAKLVAELRRHNEDFERAAAAWTEEAIARKKDVLVARTQTMLEIDLVLARLGEMELVRSLERYPFSRKARDLEAFLTKAEGTYAVARS